VSQKWYHIESFRSRRLKSTELPTIIAAPPTNALLANSLEPLAAEKESACYLYMSLQKAAKECQVEDWAAMATRDQTSIRGFGCAG
jgi:hypothetical protein